MMANHHQPSLRNRLLRHVLVPLALTWLLGTGLVISIARYFAQEAYDRALLDDAYLVASHVHLAGSVEGERLTFSLSPNELTTVLFDQSESLFFAVFRQDGSLLAGHPGLIPSAPPVGQAPVFSDLQYQNKTLRSVTVHRQQPRDFYVVMAQTTISREQLLQRLLTFSIVPQLLLLFVLAAVLRRVIQADLQPLSDLERALHRRDARDLTPVQVGTRTRDIQRLGQAVNNLLMRIAHSVRAQREFSGNVAHELRTPLAGIRAQADYGLTHKDPQVWREQLAGIAQSEERASHLVDQLLALALADEAQHSLPLAPLALDEVVQDTLMRFMPRADAMGVDLGARGLETTVWVPAHRALVEGVLNNLLDNALRYGRPSNGQAAQVTVSVVLQAATVLLTVQDNGPGISADQRQRVMRRWSQGHAGEALKEGSGLGLAIVSEYARLLNAELQLSAGDHDQGLRISLQFQQKRE
jgi:two-component system sensor histidine kinase TctE